MKFLKALSAFAFVLLIVTVLYAQRAFREYPSVEYGYQPLPPDYKQPAECAFARLMYPPGPNDGYRGRFDGDWHLGLSLWTQDYPPADRKFSEAVRRLTRISTLRGAGGESGGWRRGLQLALALCGAGGRVGINPESGEGFFAITCFAAGFSWPTISTAPKSWKFLCSE